MIRIFNKRFIIQNECLINLYLKNNNKTEIDFENVSITKNFNKKEDINLNHLKKEFKINLFNDFMNSILLLKNDEKLKETIEILDILKNKTLFSKISNEQKGILLNNLLENNKLKYFLDIIDHFIQSDYSISYINIEYFVNCIIEDEKIFLNNFEYYFSIIKKYFKDIQKEENLVSNLILSKNINFLKIIFNNRLIVKKYLFELDGLININQKNVLKLLFDSDLLINFIFKETAEYANYSFCYNLDTKYLDLFIKFIINIKKDCIDDIYINLLNKVLIPNLESKIYSSNDYFKVDKNYYENLLITYKKENNIVIENLLIYLSYRNNNFEYFEKNEKYLKNKKNSNIFYYFYFKLIIEQNKKEKLDIYTNNKNKINDLSKINNDILELKMLINNNNNNMINCLKYFYDNINKNIIINIERKRIKLFLLRYTKMQQKNYIEKHSEYIESDFYLDTINKILISLKDKDIIKIHHERKSKDNYINFLKLTNSDDKEFAWRINPNLKIREKINKIRNIPLAKRTKEENLELKNLYTSLSINKNNYFNFLYYKENKNDLKLQFFDLDFEEFNIYDIINCYKYQENIQLSEEKFNTNDLIVYENLYYNEMLEFINWNIKNKNFIGLYISALYLETSNIKLPQILEKEFLYNFNYEKLDNKNLLENLPKQYELTKKYTLGSEYNSPLFDELMYSEKKNVGNYILLKNEMLENSLNSRKFKIIKELN